MIRPKRLERAVPWLLAAALALAYGPAIARSALLQGDLPGHLESIRWSAEHLWPSPWGWDPRYLGGEPIGVLYPPLLSWLGGGLARIVGAGWALRALLIAAVVALPPCLVHAARGLGLRRSEATWAAVAGLVVLWLPQRGLGGTLHQTLVAGNAANGLVLPLFLLFVGRMRTAIGRPGRIAGAGGLLALVLLGHFLVGAVAGATLAVYAGAQASRRGSVALRRGALVAVLGLLTAAPFLLPFVVHLRDTSADAIAFSPPPSAAEWLALAVLAALLALGGRAARRAMLPAAALLALLYLLRGVVFPLAGAPDVRMEYHRFRLYLYLALVPAAALAVRRVPRARWVRPTLAASAALACVVLLAVGRYDARGPAPVPPPAVRFDAAGERVLVLASPDAQNGSWHGVQLRFPNWSGAYVAKGLFVEASPWARSVFEVERLASGPGSRPRWWGIRIAPDDVVRSWDATEALRRFGELGIGWIVTREPVSAVVRSIAVAPARDLGHGYASLRLPPAPLALDRDGVAVPAAVSADGSTVSLSLGERRRRVRVAAAWSADWRIESGDGAIRRVPPGSIEVEGRGEVVLRARPRAEERIGLVLGLLGALALSGIAWKVRHDGRAVSSRVSPGGLR